MACKRCLTKPVIKLTNNNVSLCKKCFIKYFESKVRKTVRQYNLIQKGERIGVALSGGKDSLTVLKTLNQITKPQRTTKLVAISIDEGIKGYRDKSLSIAKKYCKEENIEFHIISFKEELGYSLDEIVKKINVIPCSVCSVFRRYLLNKGARSLKLDKLATGHNLDDEVQSIVMNMFKNNMEVGARLGPITGIKDDKKFVRRIKPLYLLTEKESASYAYLNGLVHDFGSCPNAHLAYRNKIKKFISDFNQIFPATKYSILNSFLEILPDLKKKYRKSGIKYCKSCGEPTSQENCQVCQYLAQLKNG